MLFQQNTQVVAHRDLGQITKVLWFLDFLCCKTGDVSLIDFDFFEL